MKKDYMARLEKAARWRLPPQEAEDVISDYREIVGAPPRRSEEELRREVGDPEEVVKLLVSPPETYRVWLAVFFVMSACILALGISPTSLGLPIWRLFFDGWTGYPHGAFAAAILGAAAALVWFRRQGRKEARLPRAVPILLAVLLAGIGGVLWFCWTCTRDFDAFLEIWGSVRPLIGPNQSVSASFYLLTCAMAYGSTAISLAGVFALVKARTGDRRWAAVYVLALAAMLTALSVVSMAGSMDVVSRTPEELFRPMLVRCSIISAAGIVGTGVALC